MAAPDPSGASFGTILAVTALLLASAALAAWLLPHELIVGLEDAVDRTVALIRSWGPWGVPGSIGLMVVHSFLPFPAEIVALANGMVYGPVWGAAITWAGAMLGAVAAFAVVRALGQPLLKRVVQPNHWQRIAAFSAERGGLALLTARLIPLIAFNLINYAAALTEISWWTFLWATGVGILPLTVLLAVAGDGMLQMPSWCWVALTLLAALAWAAPAVKSRVTSRRKATELRDTERRAP
jgi:uncharacterized membrane protein YdjX (TVP38/TMEM64 family)